MRIQHSILLAFLLFLVACSRNTGGQDLTDVNIDLSINPNPPSMGASVITVTLEDLSNAPIEGATVELEGNMNHAGMAPVFSEANETAPGRYEADLDFTMGGDWFMIVRAQLSDGRTLERQIDIGNVHSS
ncbi:MAG: FixH family protein [Chloroflexota bacterium]